MAHNKTAANSSCAVLSRAAYTGLVAYVNACVCALCIRVHNVNYKSEFTMLHTPVGGTYMKWEEPVGIRRVHNVSEMSALFVASPLMLKISG